MTWGTSVGRECIAMWRPTQILSGDRIDRPHVLDGADFQCLGGAVLLTPPDPARMRPQRCSTAAFSRPENHMPVLFDPGYGDEPFRTLVQDVPDSSVSRRRTSAPSRGRSSAAGGWMAAPGC